MPLYEYRCHKCDHVTSVLWRNYSPPSTSRCEACGQQGAQKRISSFAFHKSTDTKLAELDPKYDKMIDSALKKSPPTSDPQYHLDRMIPFDSTPE